MFGMPKTESLTVVKHDKNIVKITAQNGIRPGEFTSAFIKMVKIQFTMNNYSMFQRFLYTLSLYVISIM